MLVGNTLSPKIQATLNVGERRFCVNVPLQVGEEIELQKIRKGNERLWSTKGPKQPYIDTLTCFGAWGEGDSGDILQGLQGGGSEATLGQRRGWREQVSKDWPVEFFLLKESIDGMIPRTRAGW